MSAVDGANTHDRTDSATVQSRSQVPDPADIPGVLAGQIADLYAASERERRRVSVERAIARARGTA